MASGKTMERSVARLAAVQALYQMDIASTSLPDILAEFETHHLGGEIDGESVDNETATRLSQGCVVEPFADVPGKRGCGAKAKRAEPHTDPSTDHGTTALKRTIGVIWYIGASALVISDTLARETPESKGAPGLSSQSASWLKAP